MITIFVTRRMKRAAVLLAIAVVTGLIAIQSSPLNTPVPASGRPAPAVVRAGNTADKDVAITFDISWGTKVLPQLLDTLEKHKVRCTFFLAGPWVANNPELARSIVARGHEIGSHGHRHLDYTRYPKEVVIDNLIQAHRVIKEVTEVEPTIFRPPNGKCNSRVRSAASDLGYTIVLWSVDSRDWKTPGVDEIARRVLSGVRPGSIVLMSASDSAKDTPAALAQILEGLKQKGYRPVTVSELIQPKRASMASFTLAASSTRTGHAS